MIDEEKLYEETMARAKAHYEKLKQEWQTEFAQNRFRQILEELKSNKPLLEIVEAQPYDSFWTGNQLSGASFERVDLNKANLRDTLLKYANFAGANLSGTDLGGSYLVDANFEGANLTEANFEGCSLSDSNLSRANLTQARLANADLSMSNLENANLTGADLSGANLMGTRLNGAIFDDAILKGTRFGNYAEGEGLGLSQSALEAIAQLDEIKEQIGEPTENY
jgi:uncharacterized protein YjbI with pentapeptide repeats